MKHIPMVWIWLQRPGHVKLHIVPDRVTVEVAYGLHVLIQVDVCGEGYVGVVS